MSDIKQRKSVEDAKDPQVAALRQYANDDGHFSLVRCVLPAMTACYVLIARESLQELSPGGPDHDYERRLRDLLHLLVRAVPLDE
jgi:hypothetical protein